MHQYRIVAQISLILPFLNIALAAPVVMSRCKIHEARGDVVPKKWRELQAASARLASPRSPPDLFEVSQHSPPADGSTSSGYPSPYLSSDSSVSGYSWMLDRPPRLSLGLSASSHGSASPGPPEQPDEPAPPHYLWEDWSPTTSYSISDGFTPSHESSGSHSPTNLWWWLPHSPVSTDFASASDGSLSSQYFSASEGSTSTTATATVPEGVQFFNKDMVRKLKFFAGVSIITGAIVGIANSPIVHHNPKDS